MALGRGELGLRCRVCKWTLLSWHIYIYTTQDLAAGVLHLDPRLRDEHCSSATLFRSFMTSMQALCVPASVRVLEGLGLPDSGFDPASRIEKQRP